MIPLRPLRCPKCRSRQLQAFCTEVRQWYPREGGWESTGTVLRKWLVCAECGHNWHTRRPLAELETLAELADA